MTPSALSVHQLTKAYPGVVALKDVSFEVPKGGVHALLGENGAGKSTLIRILSGVERADAGYIELSGKTYSPSSPLDALSAGVSTLYQQQNLLVDRSISDNVLLGTGSLKWGLFSDRKQDLERTREALGRVGASHLDPRTRLGELSVADRQMVDIARALLRDSQYLILDEPTAALSAREVDGLFQVVTSLEEQGVTVVFVSHRMEEIFRLCRRVSVLRDGEHVLTQQLSELEPNDLVAAMVGEDVQTGLSKRRTKQVESRHITAHNISGPGFDDVDLTVDGGEILAIAGVTGSGKEQLGQVLYGALPHTSGRLEINGNSVRLTPRKAISLGVVGVPADRQGEGIIEELPVSRNLALPSLSNLSTGGLLRRASERGLADRQIDRLSIKVRDRAVPVNELSGGNQQKVALGKWLELSPRVLVLLEPTQGIDVKVRFEFYRLIRRLADEGAGVVLVSSDVPEILTLADRIVVMRAGRVVGSLQGDSATSEQLVRLSFGTSHPNMTPATDSGEVEDPRS